MRRIPALILALLFPLLSVSRAESAEIARLEAENAALRREVQRLEARLSLYADPAVIAVFDGGCVTYGDIAEDFQAYLSFYSLFGMELTDDPAELINLQIALIDERINAQLLSAHTEGIALTAAEEARALSEADAAYENLLEEATVEYDGDAALAEAALEATGSDRESLRRVYREEAHQNAVFAALTAEVTISEDEIRACYEERLRRDRDYYTLNPDEYAWDRNFETVLFVPEGYRMARILTVPFSEEQQRAYDDVLYRFYESPDEEEWPLLAAQLDELHAQLLPEAEAVFARLSAGETLDELGEEYPLSAEMVYADSWAFDTAEFMRLTHVGEVTSPVPCDAGYLLIEYFAPVEAGAVAYEDVREALAQSALQEKRDHAYAKLLEAWRAEADIVYLTQRLNG